MKPIGPLMREHRVIERMLAVLGRERERIISGGDPDVRLIETGVDFFRTYADRCHHGKEEDIFFRDLEKKEVSPELRRLTSELVEEHVWARAKVRELESAAGMCSRADPSAVQSMVSLLHELIGFYPAHIEKEDKRYFFPVQEYWNRQEQDRMLEEFRDFDALLIHEKYGTIIHHLEVEIGVRPFS